MRGVLIPFLQELERLGIYEFSTWQLWFHESLGPSAKQLSRYGVEHGSSIEVPPEHSDIPRLRLAAVRGGVVDPILITRAVEAQAAKSDNQAKLEVCSAPRRHLYVGLTSAGHAQGMAWWALVELLEGRELGMPPTPVLPEAITTVWAGTGSGAIFVTPPDPWVMFCNAPLADDG